MGHIKVDTTIKAPVERVVEVASDPKHWASWWVNLGEAEKIEGDGGTGTVVEHKYLMAGVPFHVTTRVAAREQTAGGGQRVRIEFDGPLKGWHNPGEPQAPGGSRITLTVAGLPCRLERERGPA